MKVASGERNRRLANRLNVEGRSRREIRQQGVLTGMAAERLRSKPCCWTAAVRRRQGAAAQIPPVVWRQRSGKWLREREMPEMGMEERNKFSRDCSGLKCQAKSRVGRLRRSDLRLAARQRGGELVAGQGRNNAAPLRAGVALGNGHGCQARLMVTGFLFTVRCNNYIVLSCFEIRRVFA
jgi:hypothetical protein